MTEEEILASEAELRLANGVAAVLENEYLQAALQAIEWDPIVEFAKADAGDEAAVLLAKRRYDAARWFRQKLTNVVDRGKVAKARLEEERAKA